MAMQQSGKGAGDESVRSSPTLSDEQADQFAASFTPAWDTGEADDGGSEGPQENHLAANATLVDAINPAALAAAVAAVSPPPAAAPVAAPPAPAPAAIPEAPQTKPIGVSKQTIIGTPPPANANANANANAHANANQPLSSNGAEPKQAQRPASNGEGRWQEKAPSRPPPPMAMPAKNAAPAGRRVSADPFKAGASAAASDEFDVVPKKSSKTLLFVLAGLAIAGGLGVFLKFALTDDTPKAAPSAQVMGPAATTAEIPAPPPKSEPPPAPTMTAAKTEPPPQPPPAALPPPHTTPAVEPPPRAEPPARVAAPVRERRAAPPAPPPPPVVAAPAPKPEPPKTPPKPPNGGIVRDSPF